MKLLQTKRMDRYRYMIIMLIIVGVLIGMRSAWSAFFHTIDEHRVVNGVLDLRGVDLDQSPVMYLNGEWELYPDELLTQQDIAKRNGGAKSVQVPGDWGTAQNQEQESSYGYGTYRLRILTDPLQTPVTFWFKGIRSSSEIEMNGVADGGMGEVSADSSTYIPRSTSYTATYDHEGTTSIELLIRVANYDSPYMGGISKPVRFGSQAAIDFSRWYSIGFQMVTFLILLLHGIYACILYAFNPQERGLLVAAILTLSVGAAVMMGHDNILMLWLPINYTGH